ILFFFSSRRRHTRSKRDWSSDVCSSDLKSLPFGSKAKITNTANGKSVTVRVNDRGPYHGNRCFDLSKAAMEAVGGVGAGQINGKIGRASCRGRGTRAGRGVGVETDSTRR